MAVAVDIVLMDTESTPQPIVGAVVGIFDPITGNPVAQATTDVTGTAAFLLTGSAGPAGTTYEVRFFKMGVFFANPAMIAVIDPLGPHQTNIFTYSGTIVGTQSVPLDPRTCRVTGRFLNFSNQPISGTTVRIQAETELPEKNPAFVDKNIISASEMIFQTDDDGYLTVDLLRTGVFRMIFAGQEDEAYRIYIPDAPLANFSDLIEPFPVSIAWDPTTAPGNAVSLNVGDTLSVPFTALFSDGETPPDGLSAWLQFVSSDTALAVISIQEYATGVFIMALGVGTATITGNNRPNLLPVRIPYYSTAVPPLSVTVNP
jgi:hypothetical protein